MRSKMRDSAAPYLLAFGGVGDVDGEPVGLATGIAQPATRIRAAVATNVLVTIIRVISPAQPDRSRAASTRRGSRLVRRAVKTRSHRALLYNSSDSDGRLIVPIQPSPVRRSTFPLRLRTGMSRPSI